MRDRFLRALRREPVDTTPIWLMRQAGRYLPGYRRLRAQHGILEIARTPALAAEITLEPLRRFDLDAGVVFADITLPFGGLGIDFRIDPGAGPVISSPVRSPAALERWTDFDAERSVGFVGDAIRAFHAARTDRPIVGFAGGPFTLASYLIEGGASRELPATKRMLFADPDLFRRVLDRLSDVTRAYLAMQTRAGADALQLFDTWSGALSARSFERWVLPSLDRLCADLRALGRPTIYFSLASAHLLPCLARLDVDALGVDWRLPLDRVRAVVGDAFALQGNLDPGALLGTPGALAEEAQAVLDTVPSREGHIFNLGHGVLPETDPARVGELVEYVHAHGVPRSP